MDRLGGSLELVWLVLVLNGLVLVLLRLVWVLVRLVLSQVDWGRDGRLYWRVGWKVDSPVIIRWIGNGTIDCSWIWNSF